ncbi:MAG: hypothetical protein HY074_09035 [Deltaproteobacteria bacterium]|nr:hypothetical protein [Deltaproteobacteria bacterium]
METKIAKFTGTTETEQAADRMVQAVNDGFSGGRVTKHEMVSWAILYFEKHCFLDCMERIRQDHFDQVAYLESVLREAKKARKEGQPNVDLGALLSPITKGTRVEKPKARQLKLSEVPEGP